MALEQSGGQNVSPRTCLCRLTASKFPFVNVANCNHLHALQGDGADSTQGS